MIRDALIVATFVTVGHVLAIGCASAVKQIETVSDPKDDVRLSACRAEGRDASATGSEPDDAWRVYDACMKDGGFR